MERKQEAMPWEVVHCLDMLARVLSETKRHAEAEPLYRRAVALHEQKPDADPNRLAYLLICFGACCAWQGHHEAQERALLRALAILEQGTLNAYMVNANRSLAGCMWRQRRYDDAERYYRRTLEVAEQVYGTNHHKLLTLLREYAKLQLTRRRWLHSWRLSRRAAKIVASTRFRTAEEGAA